MSQQQSHIQDSTTTASCPKNLWGHSWKRLDGPGGATLQRCRFCHQIREKSPSAFSPMREKRSADQPFEASLEEAQVARLVGQLQATRLVPRGVDRLNRLGDDVHMRLRVDPRRPR